MTRSHRPKESTQIGHRPVVVIFLSGRWAVHGLPNLMETLDFGLDHRPSHHLQLQILGTLVQPLHGRHRRCPKMNAMMICHGDFALFVQALVQTAWCAVLLYLSSRKEPPPWL